MPPARPQRPGVSNGILPGQTNAGSFDAFVLKYDFDGSETWTRQFGTLESEQALGAAADTSGVYVAGFAEGTLPGQISQGGRDAFVRKYDASGNAVWTSQLGTEGITPPAPDPMTWAAVPTATGPSSITMTATVAGVVASLLALALGLRLIDSRRRRDSARAARRSTCRVAPAFG